MDGFLNILKPPGISSGSVVGYVRHRLPRGTAVGHGGTLDPEAAGVLPLCVGRATRLFDYIIDKEKEYIAEVRLGIETDTQDATGEIVARAERLAVTEQDFLEVLPRFVGEIDQVPPAFSAIKRGGQRMYDLARKGEAVELAARKVTVHGVEALSRLAEDRYLIRVTCGKGVYIRTLCHDIGRALGCGAHMSFLLRSRAGVFTCEDGLTLEEIDALSQAGELEGRLCALDAPLERLNAVYAPANRERFIRCGNPLRPGDFTGQAAPGEAVRVYLQDRFAGIGEGTPDGGVRFRAMLLEV